MPLNIKNLAYIRNVSTTEHPDLGAKLYEALQSIQSAHNNAEMQTNADSTGIPQPPPPLGGIVVTPTEVGHHVSFQHPGDFYRGVEYHGQYADNKDFTNPVPFHAGPSREIDLATGSQKLFFAGQATYPTSAPTAPVYHGGVQPIAVKGGISTPLGKSQGSGTGTPGQGLQGYGSTPFRSSNGSPPTRKS